MADRAGRWTTAPWAGLWVGGLAGALEVLVQIGRPGSAIQRAHLFEAAVVYGLVGGLLGAVLLAIGCLFRRRWPSGSLAVAVPSAAFAFLLGAGYVNLYYLPEATARSSLIYTGIILAVAILLGVGVYATGRALGAQSGARRGQVSREAERRAGPRRPWRGWALAGGVACLLACASYIPVRQGPARAAGDARGKPNVLIVLIDALRYDHLSIHGYGRETTPRIDAFARAGLLFENAYAQTSWTKPSTASILTGLYPSSHGVNLMASGVPESAPLLAETLQGAGYQTGLFTANGFITPMFGFGRGVDRLYASSPPRFGQLMIGHLLHRLMEWSAVARKLYRLLEATERALVGGGTPPGGLRAEGLTRAFLEWLDELGAGDAEGREEGAARHQGPFFAYLHLMEPHMPYDPPAPDDERFLSPRLAALGRVSTFPAYYGFLPFERGTEVSSDSLANMLALYDSEIFHADRWLGVLFDELERRGLAEKTLMVITADHGEEFYERGGWGHGHSLYNELLHVPLIMNCPPVPGLQDQGGRRIPHIARHIDLVPTILEVCAVPPPTELDGASLLPLVTGGEAPRSSRVVYSEVDHGGHSACALQQDGQKVILARRGGAEALMLFDLGQDPGELHDLAAEQPTRAARARGQLEGYRATVREGGRRALDVTIDEATREQLRGLGYIR